MKKIVLKASAGTGKTYRLSIEYIAALLNGESYKNILVMTFTKKATAEIGERVLDFLSILASNSCDESILKEKLEIENSLKSYYPNINLNSSKIREIFLTISSNMDSLKIYTIDSFIGKIFKSVIAPHIGLENYSIGDEDTEIDFQNNLLESILKDKEKFKIFKTFLGNNFEKNLEDYSKTLKSIIDSRWKYLILQESNIVNKDKTIPDKTRNSLIILDEIFQVINDAVIAKGKESDNFSKFLSSTFKNFFNLEDHEKQEFIKNNWSAILKDKVNVHHGTYLKNSKETPDLKEDLDELYDELRSSLAIKIYNTEILDFEKIILDFIETLYKNYDEMKLRDKILSFNDVTTYTFKYYKDPSLNLFVDGEITDYFQEIFDGNFKTLFIDEFQDTSVLQWKLLKGIAQKAETVFCVGDEKQSLYSWRDGEKELFEKLPSILGANTENLDTCYRSKVGIVNFTNTLFKNISNLYCSEKLGLDDLDWNFIPVNAKKHEDSYIEIINGEHYEFSKIKNISDEEGSNSNSIAEGTENDSYNFGKNNPNSSLEFDENSTLETNIKTRHLEAIADKILNSFNGVYKDIAIIGRTNSELEVMGRILANNNIPYTLKSKTNIFNHRANISAFKLLKFLSYNSFFSLLEFLRTDLINISSSELKNILVHKEIILDFINGDDTSLLKSNNSDGNDVNIPDNINISNYSNILELTLSENSLQIFSKIKDLKNQYNKSSGEISEFILELFKAFPPFDFYKSNTDRKNYYAFLEVAKTFNNVGDLIFAADNNPSNSAFAQASVEESNAVTLTSIHASKGLEYDTVFYIHSVKSPPPSSGVKSSIDLDVNFEFAKNFIIFNLKYNCILSDFEKLTGLQNYNFLTRWKKKEEQEQINTWYVALTRAKNNLFLVFEKDQSKDNVDSKGKSTHAKVSIKTLLDFAMKDFTYDTGSFSRDSIESKLLSSNNTDNIITSSSQNILIGDSATFSLDFTPLEIEKNILEENYSTLESQYEKLSFSGEEKKTLGNALHYYLENLENLSSDSLEKSKTLTLSNFGAAIGFETLKEILNSDKLQESIQNYSEIFSNKWDIIRSEYEVTGVGENLGKLRRIDRIMIKKHSQNEKGEILIVDFKTGGRDESQLSEYKEIIRVMLTKENLLEFYNIRSEFITLQW